MKTSYVERVAAVRVAPLLREHIEKSHATMDGTNTWTGGLLNVSFHTGVSSKQISEIVNERRETISVTTLDKILTGLNLEYLAHWDAEEGGFKDAFQTIGIRSSRKRSPDRRKTRPKRRATCPGCGGSMQYCSKTCRECAKKPRQKITCLDCDNEVTRRGSRCMKCYHHFVRTDPEARKARKQRKRMDRLFVANRTKLAAKNESC